MMRMRNRKMDLARKILGCVMVLAGAALSWSAQAVNYAVFGAVILLRPATPLLLALIIASCVAMFVSYFGFRYGVFRNRDTAPWEDPTTTSEAS